MLGIRYAEGMTGYLKLHGVCPARRGLPAAAHGVDNRMVVQHGQIDRAGARAAVHRIGVNARSAADRADRGAHHGRDDPLQAAGVKAADRNTVTVRVALLTLAALIAGLMSFSSQVVAKRRRKAETGTAGEGENPAGTNAAGRQPSQSPSCGQRHHF